MSTGFEKSSNPATNTAADTVAHAADASSSQTPHVIASGHEGSVRDQISAYGQRVRGGDMGMLPALAGLVVLGVAGAIGAYLLFFQKESNYSNPHAAFDTTTTPTKKPKPKPKTAKRARG
jgi:hypothetical protein